MQNKQTSNAVTQAGPHEQSPALISADHSPGVCRLCAKLCPQADLVRCSKPGCTIAFCPDCSKLPGRSGPDLKHGKTWECPDCVRERSHNLYLSSHKTVERTRQVHPRGRRDPGTRRPHLLVSVESRPVCVRSLFPSSMHTATAARTQRPWTV